MTLYIVNTATITQGVVDQLKNDTRLAGVEISRSQEIGSDPSSCPWIGVYRLGVKFPIRTLGSAGIRGQRVTIVIVLQQANPSSGADCEDDLEDLISKVMSVLLSWDLSSNSVLQFLDEFSVSYEDYTKTKTGVYMQTAAIQFTAITTITLGG
jgi:hypothetical protein